MSTIRFGTFIGAALAGLAMALPAAAADGLALRPVVTVEGPLVTLGDLVGNAGPLSEIAVFRAPDPGTSGQVSAERIIAAAREHGLDELTAQGVETVSVTRDSRRISPDEVARRVAEHLAEEGVVETAEDTQIRLDATRDLHIEKGAVGPLAFSRFEHSTQTGRFTAIASVADSTLIGPGVKITGRAEQMIEIPVLVRAVGRGDIITAADVITKRVARRGLPDNAILSRTALVGHAARNSLMSGAPVRQDSVMEPILISRNDPVTITYQVPGLTLTARGRAIGAGARGDLISVLNDQSRRTVEARVTGHGEVSVLPSGTPLPVLAGAS